MKENFRKNKIGFFCGLLFVVFAFLAFGNVSSAQAAYEYEGESFYAQATPGAYALEGISFYAFESQETDSFPVYRFYNSVGGDHFFTISDSEKAAIEAANIGYAYEGVPFYAYKTQVSGSVPVYRFANSNTSDHFYTSSSGEKAALINNPSWGYSYEGVAFYVLPDDESGASAVYRFYNASTGDHFYTASSAEKNELSLSPVYRFVNPSSGDHFYTISSAEKSIIENTSVSGYVYEGIAFYARRVSVSNSSPVYRLINPSTGDHFYTISSSERDALVDAGSYNSEGTAFYAYTSSSYGSPVYRFYNASNGDHFYTISSAEKNILERSELGYEIAVGLWSYTRSELKDTDFRIDANKAYNIKNSNGDIVAQVNGDTTTEVKYDEDHYLEAHGSISATRSKEVFYFDAADGNNSDLIFNVHRPSSDFDEYRGKIKIQYYDRDYIWVVNTLPLEQYVWGMGETTGTGDADHTRVMTTMFRTYGYWYIKYATKYNKYGFTIRSDSSSQIYYGYEWEEDHNGIKDAAKDTRAVVVTYDGDVALTPYSSWSDGETRSFEERWGSDDYPWCQSVDDPYGDYNADYWVKELGHSYMSTSALEDAGNHMVGLIAHGSVYLAAEKNWSWRKILEYYYDDIDLSEIY